MNARRVLEGSVGERRIVEHRLHRCGVVTPRRTRVVTDRRTGIELDARPGDEQRREPLEEMTDHVASGHRANPPKR